MSGRPGQATSSISGAGVTAPVRDAVVTGNCVLLRQKVIDPVGDSRPDADIERDLAQRLGLGEWFTETAEDIVRGQIDGARDPAFAGITYERLVAEVQTPG